MIYGIPPDDELGAPRRRRTKAAPAKKKKKGVARRRKAARKPGTGPEKYGGDCVPNTQGWEPCMAAWGRSPAGKRYREQQAERRRKEKERRTAARRERGVVGCELENGKSMPCLPGMEPGVYSYANYRAAQAKLTGGQRALMARARTLGFSSLAGMLSAGRSTRVSPDARPYIQIRNTGLPSGAWESIAAGDTRGLRGSGGTAPWKYLASKDQGKKFDPAPWQAMAPSGVVPGADESVVIMISSAAARPTPDGATHYFASLTSGYRQGAREVRWCKGGEKSAKKCERLGRYPAVPTPGLGYDNKMIPIRLIDKGGTVYVPPSGGQRGYGIRAGRQPTFLGCYEQKGKCRKDPRVPAMRKQARIYTGYQEIGGGVGGRGRLFMEIAGWKGWSGAPSRNNIQLTGASVYQRYFSALPGGLIWDARRHDDATVVDRDRVETVGNNVPTTQGERVGAFRFEPLGRASFFGPSSHQIIAYPPAHDPAAPTGGEQRIYRKLGGLYDLPPQAVKPYVSADLEGYFLKAPISVVDKLRWYRVGPGTLETRISPAESLMRDGARKVHPEVRKVQQRAGHWKYDRKSIGFSVTPILTADGKKFLYIEMFIGVKNAKTTKEGFPLDIFSGKPLSMIRVGAIPMAETVERETFDRNNQRQFADNAAKVTVNMVAGMPYVILPRSSAAGIRDNPFPKPGQRAYLWSGGVGGFPGAALGATPGFVDQLKGTGGRRDSREAKLRSYMAAAQKRYEDLKGGKRQVHNTLQRLVGGALARYSKQEAIDAISKMPRHIQEKVMASGWFKQKKWGRAVLFGHQSIELEKKSAAGKAVAAGREAAALAVDRSYANLILLTAALSKAASDVRKQRRTKQKCERGDYLAMVWPDGLKVTLPQPWSRKGRAFTISSPGLLKIYLQRDAMYKTKRVARQAEIVAPEQFWAVYENYKAALDGQDFRFECREDEG